MLRTETPVVTYYGENLILNALNKKTFYFTKFKIGDGKITDNDDISLFENIKNPKLEFGVSKITQVSNEKIEIEGSFNNSKITEGFRWREIGIYASENKDIEGSLFAYINKGDNAGFIENNKGFEICEQIVKIEINVKNSEAVKAILDESSIYAKEKDVEEIKSDYYPIYTTPYIVSGLNNEDKPNLIRNARIINGYYIDCIKGFGVLNRGKYKDIVSADNCSFAVMPVETNKTYTLIYQGINCSNGKSVYSAALSTIVEKCLGFVGISFNKNQLNNDAETIINEIQSANKVIDGYFKCTSYGAVNFNKFNNAYYATLIIPEGVDIVCFNTALSSSIGMTPFDLSSDIVIYEGDYDNAVQEIDYLYRIGNRILRDIEATYQIADLTAKIEICTDYLNNLLERKTIPLSEYADMVSSITSSSVDIRYNSALSEIRVHFNPISIGAESITENVNTGDVIGTVKEAYRPTFAQYGTCVIKSAGKEYIRSVEINSEGKITISNNGETATFIDNILSLDLTYNL